MKNEMGNDAETPEAITTGEGKSDSRRLGLQEFIITLVIILVIWTARKCYIANHHTGGAPSPQQPPDMTATMTESRGFIEYVLMIHSSEVDGQYRAGYDKLFQQALEAEYAKE